MKKPLRKFLSVFISLGGTLLSAYLCGYWLLIRPILNLYHGYIDHAITLPLILNSVIRIFISSTIFGGLWCVFDILAGFFRDEEEEE